MFNKLINQLNFLIQGVGFDSIEQFFQSTFHTNSFKPIAIVSFLLGTCAFLIESYLGLSPLVYITFVLLICAEFGTGIKVSQKKKIKIQSRKLGRMIVKIGIYTLLIGGLYTFSVGLKVPDIFGWQVNIYQWVYYIVLNLIIIQLLISLLENLSEMGYQETSRIFKVLSKKLERWFELKNKEE